VEFKFDFDRRFKVIHGHSDGRIHLAAIVKWAKSIFSDEMLEEGVFWRVIRVINHEALHRAIHNVVPPFYFPKDVEEEIVSCLDQEPVISFVYPSSLKKEDEVSNR